VDISKTGISSTTPASIRPTLELLKKLEQSGPIEVEVIKVDGEKLLLNSRLGTITTSNSLGYKPGDRFNIRLSGSMRHPKLKISEPPVPAIRVLLNRYPALTSSIESDQAVLARVTGVSAKSMQIEIGNSRFKIPVLAGAQKGQLVSLTSTIDREAVEISRFDPNLVLKPLLAKLLSGQRSDNSRSDLTDIMNRLNRLVENDSSPTMKRKTVTDRAIFSSQSDRPAATKKVDSRTTLSATGNSTGKRIDPQSLAITRLLLAAIPKLPVIDPPSIEKWLEISGFLRSPAQPFAAQSGRGDFRLLNQLFRLLSEFEDKIFVVGAASASKKNVGNNRRETTHSVVGETIKLIEQAMTRHLFQRVVLNLQQESSQPFSFSFALPFVEENQLRPLHIELAQRYRSPDSTTKCWDIRIDFELSGLRKIGCHIVLSDVTVSASFYSLLHQTRDCIEDAMPALKHQLAHRGFQAGDMHSYIGKLMTRKPADPIDNLDALIDITV